MAHPISQKLTENAETVACAILGKPTTRRPRELRFRRHGSLSILIQGPKRGLWHDFETGEGGDLLDLIRREHGVHFSRAVEIAEEIVGGASLSLMPKQKADSASSWDKRVSNVAHALRFWSERA